MSMRLFTLIVIIVSLYACNSDRSENAGAALQEPAAREAPAAEEGIQWFNGSIEQAFAAAKSSNKPVFLFWSAEWCPYCHVLKATILRRDEFIRQSRLFVPVYLDGDTERAQKYGEQFGVRGYPTVIIFDPQGTEITRIPGGMSIERYLGVLELALEALKPVRELVQSVLAGQEIRDNDWRLLASYSWGQDRGRALGEADMHTVLRALAAACPDRLAAARVKLQMLAIAAWAGEADIDESLAGEYAAQIEQVLGDGELARDNLTLFIAAGADMVNAMADAGQQSAVRQGIVALLEGALADRSIGVLTRIDAIDGWVQVSLTDPGENAQLSAAQLEWVKNQVAAARREIDQYEQHAALDSIADLYLNAGLVAEARATLEEGIEVSPQPFYFMSGMAGLEARNGNYDAAIEWRKRAWSAAQGPATRVQWGANYLFALIEFRPDDIQAINTAGTAVLAELSRQEEGLYQRNSGRMDRLSSSLLTWAGAPGQGNGTPDQRRDVLHNLRAKMDEMCASSSAASEGSTICDSFLVPI